jgi:hypothetical protein
MTQTSNADTPKVPRRWGKWIWFSILVLIALVIGGHAFWGYWQEKKLGEEMAALRAKGEPILAEELVNRPVADEDNAAILLREAGESIDESSKAWEEFDLLMLGLPLTEKEIDIVQKTVEENKLALAKLRQARARKGADWQLDPLRPVLSEVPDIRGQKSLASVAEAAMLLAHQQGSDREVMELASDLLAQSGAVEQMPAGLIPHFVAMGISAKACDALFEIVADLRVGSGKREISGEELKKLIDVLLNENALLEGQRLAMRVERSNQVRGAQSLRSMIPIQGEKQQRGMSIMEYLGRPLILKDGRLLVKETSETMKDADDSANWPVFREKIRARVNQHMAMRQSVRHMYLAMMGGMLDKPVERTYQARTARRLAAVALAMRLYTSEHDGNLPASLEELVPKYLPAAPGDPMASGKKLGYVAEEKRPRIYSVGADGKDDGGSDATLRKGGKPGRWVEEDVVVDLKRREKKRDQE